MSKLWLHIVALLLSANIYGQQAALLRIDDDAIIRYYDMANGLLPDTTSKATRQQITRTYNTTTASIQQHVAQQTGEVAFEYNGSRYDAYIVDLRKQQVRMHWQMPYGNAYKNLKNVKHQLLSQGQEALMLTNGGMYLEGNIPQGLFIENGTQLRPLNTRNSTYGNFYMKPNGVFCIDSSKGYVLTTEQYQRSKRKYRYATQSGPMLVIDGKIHPRFKHRSKNLHLRSGVGVMADGKLVFIISKGYETNFHDFAVIFRDLFGCDDALYLDGAISRMYLKRLRPNDLGGDFGAIISVTNK